MIRVREVQIDKGPVCDRILRALPEWFGIEAAIREYVRAIESNPTFIAETESGEGVGFLSLEFHNEYNAEIHVMAVQPDSHGKGIGTTLVKEAELFARKRGARYLSVKTLSPSRPDQNYEMTRKFYLSAGFVPLQEFKTLWGPANPCLLMIKSI